MSRQLLFALLVIICRQKLHAQVNLQTGSATFSLPLFNWQDDKSRLATVVALSYSSGNGLRVNDVASNAGQGWSFIAGGEIVRMQAGEPDDQAARAGSGDHDVTKYPPGILYATVPAANGCPNALTKYPIYGWKDQMYAQHNLIAEDKQLDYFSFQFNGKAGLFVLDPTNLGTAKQLGDSKIKITFNQDANLVNQGIRTRITSFSIQDEDGLIYKFATHGLTKVLKTNFCDEYGLYSNSSPKFKDGKVYYQAAFDGYFVNPWVINSWHLTEIEDPLTQRKVYFNYVTRTINSTAGYDITDNQSDKDYCIVSFKTSKTQSPELSSVIYPDGHALTVNYGAARFDLAGDFAMASVDVSYQSRIISKHQLNTSYFVLNRYGTPVSDYQKSVARLCLRSVRKYGIDLKEDTPPYIFDYYTGSSDPDDFVPPPFFYARDIWGFYNGDYSKGYHNETIPLNTTVGTIKNTNLLRGLCFRREGSSTVALNAKAGYARNGLLKQVIYPTGGTLSYEYGQNTGVISGNTTNVGGVHVKKTSSTDGGFSNGCSNPISTSYDYVMNGMGSASSLWGLEMPKNSLTTHNYYKPEYMKYKWGLSCLPLGCCTYQFQHPGITSQQQAISLTGFQKAMQAISPVMGILSVIGTIQNVTKFFTGSPAGLIIDVITGLATVAITCFGNPERNSSVDVYFNTDLNSAAPLPIQFKRVEVTEGSGANGKTIQEFTSSDDYAIWSPTNTNFVPKQRFANWAYGLPKTTTVLDASGNKIKETVNSYDFTHTKSILNYCQGPYGHGSPCNSSGLTSNLVSCKCEVVKSSSQRSVTWTDPAYHNPTYHTSTFADMKVDFYGMYTGRTLLTSTTEKVYKPNDPNNFLATTTNYSYNSGGANSNYEINHIYTTQSNGDISYKFFKYSTDFTGGAITTMLQNNILKMPVETRTAVYKAGVGTMYTSESVTEYTITNNGDIKPLRTLEQRFSQPTDPNTITFYQGPGSSITQFKTTQVFSYDGSGNLTGIRDEGLRSVANIYDYDDKYVVGSVVNAVPSDNSCYSSFETTGLGGWTLSGSTAYTTSSAMTGTRSFTLSAGKSFSVNGLNTLRAYTVSFWATTGSIGVSSGSTLIKSAPSINGFTYYEYDIVAGTSSVTVSGSGIIDELRLHPKTARMRTLTYDPVIGKTSECDENGRIVYYEYDNLGRLRFVKDENKSIVKMHEYNNISETKQSGCPGIYYNKLISEVYVKNNCGAGYSGTAVTYSVAANTYSSAISQEDADAQAENNILINGQTYANTNGSCQLIYYSAVVSVTGATENCPLGYSGGNVTYTVPYGKHSSLISQADANEKAQADADANAAAYINDPLNAVCNYDNQPLWQWLEGADWYCKNVGGTMHLFVKETDINPNSASYNSTRWSDVGPSDLCNSTTYSNAVQSQAFTRNDCPSGYTGSSVTYTVAAGTYHSSVSQALVNQLAAANVAANGQAYANANGTCTANGCGTCTGNDKKCINNICETGTWSVVSSVYKKVEVEGFLQWRWVCTYRYCFSDGSQSTYSEETINMSSCSVTCFAD